MMSRACFRSLFAVLCPVGLVGALAACSGGSIELAIFENGDTVGVESVREVPGSVLQPVEAASSSGDDGALSASSVTFDFLATVKGSFIPDEVMYVSHDPHVMLGLPGGSLGQRVMVEGDRALESMDILVVTTLPSEDLASFSVDDVESFSLRKAHYALLEEPVIEVSASYGEEVLSARYSFSISETEGDRVTRLQISRHDG